MIKHLILSDLHLNPGLHSEAEVAMLREESYLMTTRVMFEISRNLSPQTRTCDSPSRCGAVAQNCLLDLSSEGWQAFKSSLKLRNRLLHPKQISDLNVSDNEVFEFLKAMRWFVDIFNQSLGEVLAAAQTAE